MSSDSKKDVGEERPMKRFKVERNKIEFRDLIDLLPIEIREKIFEFLSLVDLKKLRLTTRKWNQLATHEISRRDLTALNFKFNRVTGEYVHDPKLNRFKEFPILNSKSLNQFIDCCHQSQFRSSFSKTPPFTFPCSDFTLIGGDLASSDLLNFFQVFSNRIKNLTLESIQSHQNTTKVISTNFEPIWSTHLISVEHLKIDCCHWISKTRWKNQSQFHLSKSTNSKMSPSLAHHSLKTLTSIRRHCTQCPNFFNDECRWPLIFEILNSLPETNSNFETFIGFQGNYVDFLVATKKLSTVKEYNFFIYSPFNQLTMEKVVKFGQLGPQLSSMTFLDYHHNHDLNNENVSKMIAQALTLILESSQNSLKNLEMNSFGFYPQVKIPSLSNLSNLTLFSLPPTSAPTNATVDGWTKEIFPLEINPAEIFPTLKILNFNKWKLHLNPDWWLNCNSILERNLNLKREAAQLVNLASTQPQNLPIECGMTIKNILSYFPIVIKIVQTGLVYKTINLIDLLNEFTKEVEEIEFILPMNQCQEESMSQFEADLAGMDLNSVKILRRLKWPQSQPQPPSDGLKVRPGIIDLKNLKKLKIGIRTWPEDRFEMSTNDNDNAKSFRFLSWISRENVFKWMSNVQLIIAYDGDCQVTGPQILANLSPIASTVKILDQKINY